MVQFLQPGVLVRCEYAVWLSRLREDFIALEDDMILVGVQGNACVGQGAAHGRISRDRPGLVVVAGKNRLHAELAGQMGNFVPGGTVKHNQSGIGETGQAAQRVVKFNQRLLDELDTAVGARKRLENFLVKDKHAMRMQATFQGVIKRRVVINAEIPAEPHQAAVKRLVFVHR